MIFPKPPFLSSGLYIKDIGIPLLPAEILDKLLKDCDMEQTGKI